MNIDEIKSRIREYKLQILDPIDKQGIEHIINARMGEINRPIWQRNLEKK